jgi:hypothetical protein
LVETVVEEDNYRLVQERLVPQVETGGLGANSALVEVEHPEYETLTGKEEQVDQKLCQE